MVSSADLKRSFQNEIASGLSLKNPSKKKGSVESVEISSGKITSEITSSYSINVVEMLFEKEFYRSGTIGSKLLSTYFTA